MFRKHTKMVAVTVIASAMLLSGCGLFGGEEATKEIDPPQNVTYTDENIDKLAESEAKEVSDKKVDDEKAVETVKSELYLIDENGLVVPYAVDLPKTESIAKESLEYLVVGGPVTNILPNGFRAVLPADTQVLGVNIKDDGTAIADFSPEFKDYKKEDEERILQSITWTLTQFDSVKKVKIWVNGHEQKEMPVNGTPIQDGISRMDGINYDTSDVVDITNTQPLTVYYLAETGGKAYHVPVTKRISNEQNDPIVAAVDELIKGPESTGLLSDFQNGVKLLGAPKYEDGKVTLDFNESIYGSHDEEKKMISSNVLKSIVLTLTEQEGVESVNITVNGKADLVKEDGKKLDKPVTRPQNVNTGSF
ncbi:GerMN domain-containing protein [Metabacillus fastidiosus]|uniref:GerMN domain-containing protein n=1 Tax=Metabacillus fastidiosus TaxID=1458 RepID=UPI002DB9E3D1|nr:GerMN domain-containing protein [Metabacillus fastidiosus]MEC2076828.1 GerMN domain-containing protein [Metabacillus fastidiosus]